jgi:hypothetical protein
VLRIGQPSPPRFLALEATVRQAIWRDALRSQRGMRSRSGWFVTVYAPHGATEVLFAAKRPVTSEDAAAWYAHLAPFGWRHSAHGGAGRKGPTRAGKSTSPVQGSEGASNREETSPQG